MASPEEAKRECALERQNSAPRKPKVAASPSSGTAQEQSIATLRCPRCDSSNTKFCYYNNYSLSQPRHFCKACRRYWTNGGALRNVPIGGGCRKNKKLKSSSSPASRLSDSFGSKLDSSFIAGAAFPSSSSDVPAAGFRSFPAGLSPVVDFQISGLSSFHQLPMMPFPSFANVFNTNSRIGPELPVWFSSSYPSLSSSSSSSTSIASGLYSSSSATQEMAGSISVNPQSSLAASIESLSSLNQDLHWKLQQQRYATLLGPTESNTQKGIATFLSPFPPHSIEAPQVVHRPQPVSMQSQEFMLIKSDNIICSRKDRGDTTATELLSGNSYDSSIIPDAANNSGSGNGSAQAWSHSNLHGFQVNLP